MRPALALFALASLWCRPAAADKMDETLDLSVVGRGSWAAVDGPLTAAPAVEGVPLVDARGPRLDGAQLWGGLLDAGLNLEGFRVGLATGLVSGPGFTTTGFGPLGSGLRATPGSLWGLVVEGRVGYAFGSARDVQPYVDLRGGLLNLQTQVTLTHDALGALGSTPYNTYLPIAALRVGVRIPIDDWLVVDAGLGASPVGAERASGSVAIGLPIPLANL